jgi:hypothetical protein
MHLVACLPPQEPLEIAPRSALLADLTDGEEWEGFWALDLYYVRCTRADGSVEWFRLADDDSRNERGDRRKETRVLHFPTSHRPLQTRVLVAKSPDGRRMLVGTATRSSAQRRSGRSSS